ncbi:MAG: hypothetical protein LCI00_19290 [Chloroflexi bacterium]|nr:hypothetical protein [Chloroflexota bacterium]
MALAGDHVQVLVGGYELTGDMNRVTVNDTYDMHDITAFSDGAHRFIQGQRKIALEHAGYLNSQAAGSHPVLKDVLVNGIVSVLLGQNAPPAVGDPVHSLSALQGKYSTLPEVSKVVPFGAQFANRGDLGGWGVMLTPPVTITNTSTGSGVDEGAATTKGGAAFLHILQVPSPDTYTVIVEGATNAGFSVGLVTLATFTLNGSALGSERIAINGSIPQYTRYKATRSGTAANAFKLAVGLVRF